MRRRQFYPPAVCSKCNTPPQVGDSLLSVGAIWLCPACLADETPGNDLTTKALNESVWQAEYLARSGRSQASGHINDAGDHKAQANWHGHAVKSIRSHGNRLAKSALIVNGEAATAPGYLKDTLVNPDLFAIESSETRGRMLVINDIAALGIDVANTIGASNTLEKLLAHEIALAHKVACEQSAKASRENDPEMEIKRLHVSARMMGAFQQGVLTLQKLRTGGTQNVIVQHVHVADGGQAVIGAVQTRGGEDEK